MAVIIDIDADAPGIPVNRGLYGIFFEEINHAGDGGIYSELVQNRNFEANTAPEGATFVANWLITPARWIERKWFNNELPGWDLVAEGGAVGNIRQVDDTPLNPRNPHSMRLTARKTGKRLGVANKGYWGMNFRKGEDYCLSFYARTEKSAKFDLKVSLESHCGHKILAARNVKSVGGKWRKYSCTLTPKGNERNGRLVIEIGKPGTIWFDVVSLFPRNTFRGRPNGLRKDLVEMLAALKPGFLRFPGGCVVEGVMMSNRFQWKDSIGDITERRGNFNLWGYYSSNGLGFHEYLQLCEDLGTDAMYVVNAGMSCQARNPEFVKDQKAVQAYVDETLGALEYAMGPADSTWGAVRAENGHPAPFAIKYVEIGNENSGPEYHANYRMFYDAIKSRWPELILIADSQDMGGHPVEMQDDHYYNTPDWFFDNVNKYDGAKRGGPDIYVGEYACNSLVGQGNLLGALSEAAFMIGMERNADLVKICSYAPLFVNVNDRSWPVNLIEFDSSRVIGRSSYHVQKLFAENRPDQVCGTELKNTSGGTQGLFAVGGLDTAAGELIVKIVNRKAKSQAVDVRVNGVSPGRCEVRTTTLGHADPTAENSLDDPEVVVPVCSVKKSAKATVPPYSLVILRIPWRRRSNLRHGRGSARNYL